MGFFEREGLCEQEQPLRLVLIFQRYPLNFLKGGAYFRCDTSAKTAQASTQLSIDKCASYHFLVTHIHIFLIDKSFKPISFTVLLTHSQSSYLEKKQMANEGLANTKAIRMNPSPEHTLQYSNPDPVSAVSG